jgi:hypothetical protein
VLGQHVGVWTRVAALAVLACVAVAQRSRVATDPVAPEP